MPAFYNRYLAAGYALNFALSANPQWIRDSVTDCTNFISQALYFGGWPMTAGAGNDDITAWYNTGDDSPWLEGFARSSYRRSRSWGAAQNFRRYLTVSGRARPCKLAELTIGDVVQHVGPNGEAHHTMMITGSMPPDATNHSTGNLHGKVLLASYHSRDRRNYPLELHVPPAGDNLFWKILDSVPDTESQTDAILEDRVSQRWSHSLSR